MLVNQGIQHIQQDQFTIRMQVANAWATAFEVTKEANKQSLLNQHFIPVMQNLHQILRLEETVQRN